MSQTLLNYQQVLEQLQVSADKIAGVTELLESQSELVLEHNEDVNAHAYLQQRINDISVMNPITVGAAVSNHDTSSSAHADIRTLLNTKADASAVTEGASTVVDNHNNDYEAHPELRSLIENMADSTTITNNINTTVSDHNASNSSHPELRTLISDAVDGIALHNESIDAHPYIQGKVSDVDNRVTALDTSLNSVLGRVTGLEQSVQNIHTLVVTLEEMVNDAIGTNNGINMAELNYSFPSVVIPGESYTLTLSGIAPPQTGTLIFSIEAGTSGLTFSKTDNISTNEAITVTVPSGITRGAVGTFRIGARHSDSATSGERIVPFAVNRLPVSSAVAVSNIPAIVKPNSTTQVTISGGSDPDGQTLTYSLSSNKAYVTFSKSTGIINGETVTMTYSGASVRGETPTVTVTVSDGLETATKTITLAKVNTLPVSTNIVATGLPTAAVPGGSAYTFKVSGATDAEDASVTYTITGGAGLNMTPTTGITANTNIVFNATKVASNTNISFTVYAVDSLGEQSTTGKSFTVAVRPIIHIDTPSITSPTSGQVINLPFTFVGSAYNATAEL